MFDDLFVVSPVNSPLFALCCKRRLNALLAYIYVCVCVLSCFVKFVNVFCTFGNLFTFESIKISTYKTNKTFTHHGLFILIFILSNKKFKKSYAFEVMI
jgi:hypothetical protein